MVDDQRKEAAAELLRLKSILLQHDICPCCGEAAVEVDEDGIWFCTTGRCHHEMDLI